MLIETQRLLIRDIKTEDEIPFVKMAAEAINRFYETIRNHF